MEKNISRFLFYMLASAACLALALIFGGVLSAYAVPTQDASYDLSLNWEGEALPEDWQYDQKGWTVFMQEGERTIPLTADGMGGFTGLREAGETFYFSRVLTETPDAPILWLDAANCTVAVFLDGELLYTDCPKLDNRIGYLTLPMLDFDRTKPIMISLPPDCQGKTLAIAQSTGFGEKQEPEASPVVWLRPVTLYCGYSYESGLISKSFRTAIPAALCYGVGVLLLAVFLWQLSFRKADWSLPFLALSSFLWSTRHIAMSGLPHFWPDSSSMDVAGLSRLLSLTVLLLFLASRLNGKIRLFFGILTALQGVSTLLAAIPDINSRLGFLWQSVPERIGLFGLIGILVLMIPEWKKKNLFFRIFCPASLAGLAVLTAWTLAVPTLRREMVQQLFLGSHGYFLWKLMGFMMAAAILAALIEWAAKEIARRVEAKLLVQQYEAAQSGFENLRRYQEEVMMMHHDIRKHLLFLRQSTSDKATADYLEELIGQQQAPAPPVQTRNRTLDIILGEKLREAAEKGIAVEVVQSDAPEFLPLSDAELCALTMNLLDNAICAAAGTMRPFLRLDMHQKNGFFVFVCENAADFSHKKEAVPQHGLGLRIIEQIINRHGALMEAEQLTDSYRVTIALPPVTPLNNA